VRRIVISAIAAWPALADVTASDPATDEAAFGPKAMVLAPDTSPQIPMPEKFWGEPLPAPHEKAFLVKQALQLTPCLPLRRTKLHAKQRWPSCSVPWLTVIKTKFFRCSRMARM